MVECKPVKTSISGWSLQHYFATITKDILAYLDEELREVRILGSGKFIKELRQMRELDAKFSLV